MKSKRAIAISFFCVTAVTILSGGCEGGANSGKVAKLKKDYPIDSVPLTAVNITDGFWGPRIETNRTVTIPHIFRMCEKAGRIDNFAIAAGLMEGQHRGSYPFDDTDVYKAIEAASYSLMVQPDRELEKYIDNIIAKIAAAQETDGYLYTARTNKSKRLASWFGRQRWSKLSKSHELYNMGHLYEAAAAYYEATGKKNLLKVAIKNAKLIDKEFGPGKNEKWPGHQVIEMGLVKLYRVTGDEKYLNLAKFFLDTRGPGGGEYAQAHSKPYEQTEAVGHAVRATYMYCGMADAAALAGDQCYKEAAERLWDNVVGKKLYINGGVGAAGSEEAFGKEYELPNLTAYNETCAAIGNAMWNHRMFLLTGEAKYIDVLERTLYNGLISGVSLEGNRFFYTNPLASDGKHNRQPWFKCACCPPNLARFIASLPGYIYAKADDKVFVNLFVAGEGTIQLEDTAVLIRQHTQYPWDGAVKIAVEPTSTSEDAKKFTIAVRIPGWARGKPVSSDLYRYIDSAGMVSLKLNGEAIQAEMKDGYACIRRIWKPGDVVELDLPMPVRRVLANEKVEADTGKVAIERGPIVYCAEGPDNDGNVLDLTIRDDETLTAEYHEDMLKGVTVIRGKTADGRDVTLIPYYAWANRGPHDAAQGGQGQMAVWLGRKEPGPVVEINVARTKEPISKYIYGQFIEHLGRCIYGGIWAEMLEDRKFYYPITDEYSPWATASDEYRKSGEYKYIVASPWAVVGPAGTVTMDANNPYVGEHTPVIHLPGDGTPAGISQSGLAIEKGKVYVGRIILAGDSNAAPVIVRIVPEVGEQIDIAMKKITGEFRKYSFGFTAEESSDNVAIDIVGEGSGTLRIGTVSLMPADNIKGWRKDVVELLRELGSPVYRWPGGNFVSGYNWRDGIGERDRRPPRKNPAWKGIEHNDVGIHEYMELMELIGAEAFIAVNTGLGTVEEVGAEVEYCNGSADTPMGKLRADNGHTEPYDVKWWAVGNEMYGDWQLGYMPLEEYVKKHIRVAKAIWAIDPDAKLVAVGQVGNWSRTMLKDCPDYMDLISEHIYCKGSRSVLQHTRQLMSNIRRVTREHRKYRKEIEGLKQKDIRIAMDEWNYWYGDYIYGELGVRYHLKDAIGVAMGLHEYFRNSDLYFMANYAQTVNVIGAIKTTRTDSAFATTGLVLKMYRQHYGTVPVEVTGGIDELDVAAAWTDGRKALTIGVVNPLDRDFELGLELKGATIAGKGRQWLIAGDDPMLYNEPGEVPKVVISERTVSGPADELAVPAYSVSIYELPIN